MPSCGQRDCLVQSRKQKTGGWWGEGPATLAKGHAFVSIQELQLCPAQSEHQEKAGFLLRYEVQCHFLQREKNPSID